MSLFRRNKDTRLRKDRTGANPFTVGIVVLLLIGIGVFFGFTAVQAELGTTRAVQGLIG